MAMPGIRFVAPRALEAALNVRADIALFAGLIPLRNNIVKDGIPEWVLKQWDDLGFERETNKNALDPFRLPVRLESIAQFDSLFEDCRLFAANGANIKVPTSLGVAVRAFFAEGGITCYVVRCGDPLTFMPDYSAGGITARKEKLAAIIPGSFAMSDVPSRWSGLEHVLGLDDVSMVVLPDLPDLFAVAQPSLDDNYTPPLAPEVFRPADTAPAPAHTAALPARPFSAPRLDAAARASWRAAVSRAAMLLDRGTGNVSRHDVQLILTLPLPPVGHSERESEPDISLLLGDRRDSQAMRLQFTYPWVQTRFSSALPEGLQGSDGVVAGILARNAVSRGAYLSAAGLPSKCVSRLAPALSRDALATSAAGGDWLGDGITILGQKQSGVALLSDSTASTQKALRAASLRRLQGIVLRAARLAGQDLVFEGNLASTWTRLRHRLEDYMTELWQLGAFDGETAQDAFEVRCGPSTMTQNDIDAGRMIAQILFTSMQPIERMTIMLEFSPQQSVSLRAA